MSHTPWSLRASTESPTHQYSTQPQMYSQGVHKLYTTFKRTIKGSNNGECNAYIECTVDVHPSAAPALTHSVRGSAGRVYHRGDWAWVRRRCPKAADSQSVSQIQLLAGFCDDPTCSHDATNMRCKAITQCNIDSECMGVTVWTVVAGGW